MFRNMYMDNPKISIIIPCYNMRPYLSESIGSIVNQSMKELEIICIDDGSDDGTKEFLENYKKRYDNIVLISQDNEGSGCSRNRGIELATGNYIAFMDADDFYPDSDILEFLYNTALTNEADICGGSFCTYRNGVYTYEGFRKDMVFKKDGWILKNELSAFGGYWRFLYKRKFLVENNILFPFYKRAQDVPFFVKAISAAGRVYCVKKVVYCYRKEHKLVRFDECKAVDYVKAIKDSLLISKNEGLDNIYIALLKEIHGEITALIYYFAQAGSMEMRKVIHDINLVLQDREDSRKMILLEGKSLDNHVKQIWEERKNLFIELNKYSKILIYGAGTIGRKVLNFLKDNQYEPDAFIVSDVNQNPDNVEGVRVRAVGEYTNIRDECFVLVATFSYLHEEIKKTLYEKGFTHFYLIDLEKFYLWCGGIVH